MTPTEITPTFTGKCEACGATVTMTADDRRCSDCQRVNATKEGVEQDDGTLYLDPEDLDQVKMWLNERVAELGMGFHPDTPFTEYVNAKGERIYSDLVASVRQTQLDMAFDICEDESEDIYGLALQVMSKS